jgi:AhpD family alkylhydroperoxidase
MDNDYPASYKRLQALIAELSGNLPGTMRAFTGLHKQATADGALDRKTKELIALGMALSINCGGCVAYHVKQALESGASREEILEAIGVAVMMGGGPAVVYGCEALAALDQFQAESNDGSRALAP